MKKTYILNIDFANGVLPNTNGKPNMLFKKGDEVSGELVEKFIFNKNVKGVFAKPTIKTGIVETQDGMAFIPAEYLVEKIETKPTPISDVIPPTKNNIINYVIFGVMVVLVIKFIMSDEKI